MPDFEVVIEYTDTSDERAEALFTTICELLHNRHDASKGDVSVALQSLDGGVTHIKIPPDPDGAGELMMTIPLPGQITHLCPPGDEGLMPCCGRTPFEVPRTDRMTLHEGFVTCLVKHDEAIRDGLRSDDPFNLWSVNDYEDWENTLAEVIPDDFEDDVAQVAIIENFVKAAAAAYPWPAETRQQIIDVLSGPFDGTDGLDSITLGWAIARIEELGTDHG